MKMSRILLTISKELHAAIDAARGRKPRNPFIESQLWKTKQVKDGATEAGVEPVDRPVDGRGGKPKDD